MKIYTLDEILKWAWLAGINVTLSSYKVSVPLVYDGPIAASMDMIIPIMNFSRDNKSFTVEARGIEELARAFTFQSYDIAKTFGTNFP